MKRIFLYIILIVISASGITRGQSIQTNIPGKLEKLFNRLIDNYNDTDRLRINDSIKLILDGYVRSDSVFTHRFTDLRYLGQIMSPDSMVKIVTWNLVLQDQPGRYNCYFIKKGEHGKSNITYKLSASYNPAKIKTDTLYHASDWYGALYYDLKPYNDGDTKCYLLLGIDYGNAEISRKLIDVLRFSTDGSILFGRKWFDTGEGLQFRAVFEYASNAMMTVRFHSMNQIVFDHLVPFSDVHKDDRAYYGPDYSFDAYNFENGIWKLKINVDARNQE